MTETSYTLKQLATIFNYRFHLPKDRFLYYFINRYGYSESEAKEAFALFTEFPKNIHDDSDSTRMKLDKIIPLCIEVVEGFLDSWDAKAKFKNLSYNSSLKKKFIYKKDEEVREFVVDFYKTNEVITYAELSKQKIEPIALLSFCCQIENRKNKNLKGAKAESYMDVYEGGYFRYG